MMVIDASALLELLLQTPRAKAVEDHLLAVKIFSAPDLLDLEVAQVLRRSRAAGEMSSERAREALQDLRDLSIRRYASARHLDRIWALSRHVSAYDAVYLALAEGLSAPFLTCDEQLKKTPGLGVDVIVV